MTSAPVKDVGSLLNFVGNRVPQTKNMGAAESFGDVMSKASGNQPDFADVKKPDAVKAQDVRKPDADSSYASEKVSNAQSSVKESKSVKADESAADAVNAYRAEYKVIDQDLPPFVIAENGTPVGTVNDGDSVIFFNFRGDRSIEISKTFDEGDTFDKFDRVRHPKVVYAGMLEYDGDLHIPSRYLVNPPEITNTMGEYLADMIAEKLTLVKKENFKATRKGILNPEHLTIEERNALIKAKECYKITNLPSIGMDDSLYLEGVPDNLQPGLFVRRVNGKTLSDEEMLAAINEMGGNSSEFIGEGCLAGLSAVGIPIKLAEEGIPNLDKSETMAETLKAKFKQ